MDKYDFGPIISTRFRDGLTAKGKTLKDAIEDLPSVPAETLTNLYYGRSHDPRVSTLAPVSEYLGMSINCLLGKCQHSSRERALLLNYRRCGRHGKSVLDLTARYEARSIKRDSTGTDRHPIPCIVPHGYIYKGFIRDLCDTVEIMTTHPDAYSAILLTENDLAPRYCKDDVLLFENRFPRNGEIAAFFTDELVYIRRYIEENGVYRLQCLHKHGEDMILKRMDEVDYIGPCIDVVRYDADSMK